MNEVDKKAVALRYEQYSTPRVIAKGDYEIAEAMIQNAISQGIPVTSDPALVGLLMNLELNEEIPEELYVAVAVILSWVYWLRGDVPEILT
tara:strand:+ start:1394 stop:1666 length:273 start_codon:yes stop_codon:yes gene_type:complete